MFMTVKQASEKWGISDRRVRILCAEGKIPGAYQEGRAWKIPIDAIKPADGRYKTKESLLSQIDRKKKELDGKRPLTEGELTRLNEEFTVEYTYNSNPYKYQNEFKEAARKAREENKGLWTENTCVGDATKPADTPAPKPQPAPAPTAPAPQPQQSQEACVIKGNVSRNGKIYHMPGQKYYNKQTLKLCFAQK